MLTERQTAETRMAVKLTEEGWISAVRMEGCLYVAELCGGSLYFAELLEMPAGFDPLDGIAQRADTLGVKVLCYSPETGAELIG